MENNKVLIYMDSEYFKLFQYSFSAVWIHLYDLHLLTLLSLIAI